MTTSFKFRVLVTAGPTQEFIDPVRYLTNLSSGQLGYGIAAELKKIGARVILISGPTSLKAPTGVRLHHIRTALQMARMVQRYRNKIDAFISTAAVSDYRVGKIVKRKIKKNHSSLVIRLIPNPDILKDMGKWKKKRKKPLLVGFALETHRLMQYAKRKLKEKNLDLIIGNSPRSFGSKSIQPVWIEKGMRPQALSVIPKNTLAKKLGRWLVHKLGNTYE